MRQHYHTIIRCEETGVYVGWVEEVPGTLTHGASLEECESNLREALQLVLETNRDEARLALDDNCIQGLIDIEVGDLTPA